MLFNLFCWEALKQTQYYIVSSYGKKMAFYFFFQRKLSSNSMGALNVQKVFSLVL